MDVIKTFVVFDPKAQRLTCSGGWNLLNLAKIKKQLRRQRLSGADNLKIDGSAISNMDSAGALILSDFVKTLDKKSISTELEKFTEEALHLIDIVKNKTVPLSKIPQRKLPNWLASIGKFNIDQTIEFMAFLNFAGVLFFEFVGLLFKPHKWRINSLVNVLDNSGYRALPIIGLLSFMIGVVLAYQMGTYLRDYGASAFIVNLLGISILREFGPLITAIIVAGRTGASYTAELGIMKVNQELDALRTMGVTPAEILLLPRIIGLFIALPLLTVWACSFGVLGGMLMTKSMLDISYYDFIHRFQHEVAIKHFFIGVGKAPVFALIIASIGCFQGMQVTGTAESVGRLTTRSVVLCIFFIIVADAIFSVIFSRLDL